MLRTMACWCSNARGSKRAGDGSARSRRERRLKGTGCSRASSILTRPPPDQLMRKVVRAHGPNLLVQPPDHHYSARHARDRGSSTFSAGSCVCRETVAAGALGYGDADRLYLPAGSVGFEQHDRFAFRDPRLGVPADVGDVFAYLPRENALEGDLRHGLAAAQDPRRAAVLGNHGVQAVDLPRPAVGEEPYLVARELHARPRRWNQRDD